MDFKDDMTFTIVNDEGVEMHCEMLFSFDCEKTSRSYLVYTDHTMDEDGHEKVYASIVESDETGGLFLHPLTSQEEFDMLECILEELQNGS